MSEGPEDLHNLMRAMLNKLAADEGVPNPEHLHDKPTVIAAIEDARAAKAAARPNPAVVPEPEVRLPRAYRVIGPNRVYETDTGGEFTALFTPAQEAALIEGGHIEPKENG